MPPFTSSLSVLNDRNVGVLGFIFFPHLPLGL